MNHLQFVSLLDSSREGASRAHPPFIMSPGGLTWKISMRSSVVKLKKQPVLRYVDVIWRPGSSGVPAANSLKTKIAAPVVLAPRATLQNKPSGRGGDRFRS
uniref:MATH domain-containing protein n=1 Tax=Steinernema glaseri TaxID=37863 RepID=A0A1I8AFM3_9BILA